MSDANPARALRTEELPRLLLAAELPPGVLEATLRAYGFERPAWADEILQDLAGEPVLRQELARILPRLLVVLRDSADAEMGLLNFARFAEASISKATFFSTLQFDPNLIEVAVALFSSSQYFSDILIRDVRSFEWLRGATSSGTLRDRDRMTADLAAEVDSLQSSEHRVASLRRFKRLEMLRIGFADIVRESPLERVTADLSNVADAALETSYRCGLERLHSEWGVPRQADGQEAGMAILALGKLGGRELNYSSDIDILFLYSSDGEVEAAPGARRRGLTNQEFFDRLAEEIIRWIAEPTEGGFVFRVDTRLRPDGQSGPLTRGLASALNYYATAARMWERQALIKARCAAGCRELGERFIQNLQPLIYRKYLTFEEIREIKEVKEQMERKAAERGERHRGVKLGSGGIRDIEYVVQFHQLLLGGQDPSLRTGNTLEALRAFGKAGILASQEITSLETAYLFLRKTEHRLQTLHQLKLHALPEEDQEVERLARRMNFRPSATETAAQAFLRAYRGHTETVRKIFERTFGRLFDSARNEPHPEVGLILSAEADPQQVQTVLGSFGFENPTHAGRILSHLAEEDSPLLRSPRTREYLASLAPILLGEIRETPRPDQTLMQFDRVLSSLGAKTMVYQWLSEERGALPLLLHLCSSGQFLVELLAGHPGMFDDLLDSLVVRERKDPARLEAELERLLAGADTPLAILTAFRNAELLRIGTRDVLGRSGPLETFEDLSHLAQAVLRQALALSTKELEARYGVPAGPAGRPIPFAILALGKFGGQELNYFSDLDVLFAFEEEGQTRTGLYASDFFTRLAHAVTRLLSEPSPYGKLFDVDARLRPMGSKGPLACSAEFLEAYYHGGRAQTWERQALTRVRFAAGCRLFGARVVARLQDWAFGHALTVVELQEILEMRRRLEASVSPGHLKRGSGGIVDIEFLLQILALRHGHSDPALRVPAAMALLEALRDRGHLGPDEAEAARDAYLFLRRLENRLRMVTNRAVDEFPQEDRLRDEIAYSMGLGKAAGRRLIEETASVRAKSRALFECVSRGGGRC
ncbi:MAG: bifunctional [glutamate--ammonia ligase]-adenylyl-L-tyrosine phosphorylase/[glutamate--ammonia-ligase] adenylyltransferase [Planctomycetes bacterium]|nr:bifunctional [glutamate--ammonia ligase]-adenylyl-L-tyrosine phosphorylase/[glutamate--ammonia-ligase] adenylyltransferase [Planctomycetota bacterium]